MLEQRPSEAWGKAVTGALNGLGAPPSENSAPSSLRRTPFAAMTPRSAPGRNAGMATKTYEGSCHCGKVKYKVKLDLDNPIIVCNCSMCQRAGTMLAFGSRADFELLSGEEDLKSYKFNKNIIDHVFCTTCGIKPFAYGVGRDGAPTSAVNVRCLEGVELNELETHAFDGRSS